MDVYKTEDEQVEALRHWWERNSVSLFMGIALGLAAVFGWKWWQDNQRLEVERASNRYQRIVVAINDDDPERASAAADSLRAAFPNTGYAVFAGLILARIAVERENLDEAGRHLNRILRGGEAGPLEPEVRLRLARIRAGQGSYAEALKALDVRKPGQYTGVFEELRGDIRKRQGDSRGAHRHYQSALRHKRAAGLDTALLQAKLDDLGDDPGLVDR